ncbi:MAG: biotin/lipoyl-containing protein [Candidatus Thalassarchaeaceae archaeon]|jgi:biotin carboxyl carrier protein|nr:biotin/lipoyl-containing protein [Candidatus Thalassarchaeaceae archaeon]
MIDILDSNGRHWHIQFSGLELIEAKCDDEEVDTSLVIETDARAGRIWINHRLAHISKVGDNWWVHIAGRVHVMSISEQGIGGAASEGGMSAPMPGKILEVICSVGDEVDEGDPLIVMEAMKMEHRINAMTSGTISAIHFVAGEQVEAGAILVELESGDDSN